MNKKNLLIAQSGGPTCVINASLVGVIKEAIKNDNINTIFGAINGVDGIINNKLTKLELSEEELDLLSLTPSAYLGSARHILSRDHNDEEHNKILSTIKGNNIGYICFIGGNDSMDTVDKLSNFFLSINYPCNVIGVPKTIDNDLVLTDHTPGYGSAIKYIANTIEELSLDTDCYEKGRVTIVEIMGRDAGWLTAGSKLASLNGCGPDLIYLPEVPFDFGKFYMDVERIYNEKKKCLIAVSEGLKISNGQYVLNAFSNDSHHDKFGHLQLGGLSQILATLVKQELDLPTRYIELNLMQRCSSHIASSTDINEALSSGAFALQSVINKTAKFVSFVRKEEYQISYELKDVKDVANKVKCVPTDWIINGNDVSDEFIKYALPLIKGEVKHTYQNGVIKYLKRK